MASITSDSATAFASRLVCDAESAELHGRQEIAKRFRATAVLLNDIAAENDELRAKLEEAAKAAEREPPNA